MDNPYIGRHYWPIDNSFCINLSHDGQRELLAGHRFNEGKSPERTTILLGPFKAKVTYSRGGDGHEKDFVIVQASNGTLHRVMFFEHGLEEPQPEKIPGLKPNM